MIDKHGRQIFGEIYEVRKGLWAFFLGCAFGMLIGWTEKLRSHECYHTWKKRMFRVYEFKHLPEIWGGQSVTKNNKIQTKRISMA